MSRFDSFSAIHSRRALLGSSITRNALGIGVASGAYAISFGAISTTAGLSVLQTCLLSLVMFTGASQFALVGVIAVHGSYLTATTSALLLGTRNGLYGLRLSSILDLTGIKRFVWAQFVIDETTAMAIREDDPVDARLAFAVTATCLYICWNLGTVVGAVGASSLSDPHALGLDAAPPAAFLALLAPRLTGRGPLALALLGAMMALLLIPFVPAGVPVIVSGLLVGTIALLRPELVLAKRGTS